MTKESLTIAVAISALVSTGVFVAVKDEPKSVDTVQSVEAVAEAYKSKTGKYPHVQLEDGVREIEGKTLPDNMRVNEYVQWDGQKGYEVQYETATATISIGYGPQAAERTWVQTKDIPKASSTKKVQ